MYYATIESDTKRVRAVYRTPPGFSPPQPSEAQDLIQILEQEFQTFQVWKGPIVFDPEEDCLVFNDPPETPS